MGDSSEAEEAKIQRAWTDASKLLWSKRGQEYSYFHKLYPYSAINKTDLSKEGIKRDILDKEILQDPDKLSQLLLAKDKLAKDNIRDKDSAMSGTSTEIPPVSDLPIPPVSDLPIPPVSDLPIPIPSPVESEVDSEEERKRERRAEIRKKRKEEKKAQEEKEAQEKKAQEEKEAQEEKDTQAKKDQKKKQKRDQEKEEAGEQKRAQEKEEAEKRKKNQENKEKKSGFDDLSEYGDSDDDDNCIIGGIFNTSASFDEPPVTPGFEGWEKKNGKIYIALRYGKRAYALYRWVLQAEANRLGLVYKLTPETDLGAENRLFAPRRGCYQYTVDDIAGAAGLIYHGTPGKAFTPEGLREIDPLECEARKMAMKRTGAARVITMKEGKIKLILRKDGKDKDYIQDWMPFSNLKSKMGIDSGSTSIWNLGYIQHVRFYGHVKSEDFKYTRPAEVEAEMDLAGKFKNIARFHSESVRRGLVLKMRASGGTLPSGTGANPFDMSELEVLIKKIALEAQRPKKLKRNIKEEEA